MIQAQEFRDRGYQRISNFLDLDTLSKYREVLEVFHNDWLTKNQDFYNSQAINSAYLTKVNALADSQRRELLQLVSSPEIAHELRGIFAEKAPCFLNTQLFFDPKNKDQKNYWHRDIQYTGLSQQEQIKVITEESQLVVHFRIAFKDENGIELIPGSHKRWDTPLELSTRLQEDGRSVDDQLPNSESVSLNAGDLLIFSANIIHRGLYGRERFSLDILFCEDSPNLLSFIEPSCYPRIEELKLFSDSSVFRKFLKV